MKNNQPKTVSVKRVKCEKQGTTGNRGSNNKSLSVFLSFHSIHFKLFKTKFFFFSWFNSNQPNRTNSLKNNTHKKHTRFITSEKKTWNLDKRNIQKRKKNIFNSFSYFEKRRQTPIQWLLETFTYFYSIYIYSNGC